MIRYCAILALAGLSPLAVAESFTLADTSLRVGANPTSIAVADLTGDDIPEIIVANRGRLHDPDEERPAEDSLSLFIANDIMQYTAQPQLKTGFGPYAVVVANIDALKAPDILIANFMATRNRDLTLLRNIGDNLFEPHQFSLPDDRLRYTKSRDGDGRPIFPTPGLTALAIHDIDGDGLRDAIATGWTSDILAFFPGHAETYFGKPVITELPGGPRDIVLSDIDGDGNQDLIVALYSSNEIALLHGDGTGAFSETSRFSSRGHLPNTVAFTDINRDDKPDIVVSHAHADDSIVIFYGEGTFRFSASQEILLGKDRNRLEHDIRHLVTGDFNNDERNDLAVACHESGSVIVLTNDSYTPKIPQNFDTEPYQFDTGKPRTLTIADINLDGKPDLVVGLWESNQIRILTAR